jgi:hypothetical protein
MMLAAIHQPHYLPWLRYVEKIATSDIFILLDDVAYTKNGWQNRNKIKCATGWMYLTVPISASFNQPIKDVPLGAGNWGEKHLRSLQMNYGRAPYFEEHFPFFCDLYCRPWALLHDVNSEILSYCLDRMGIRTPILRSSELSVPGVSTERLIHLCRAIGATEYYSGEYAVHAYLDPSLFEKAGIRLRFQQWKCPEYLQQFPKMGFMPDMSIVDLLFNEGPNSLNILQQASSQPLS